MTKITQIFILSAGEGKRMRPLTKSIPKPLVKVKNKALIDHIIKKIDKLPDLERIIINSHYLADILENHIQSLNHPKIIISKETEKLETGGGLVNAMKFFDNSQPILIINSDLFWLEEDSLLKKMATNFDANKMDILLALTPKNQFFGYDGAGDFNLNKVNGQISVNKNKDHFYAYIGLQILHPRILQSKPPQKCFSLNHFFKKAVNKDGILEKIKGFEVENKTFHIGTVKALEEVNRLRL